MLPPSDDPAGERTARGYIREGDALRALFLPLVCAECGDDDAACGYRFCLDCLEMLT